MNVPLVWPPAMVTVVGAVMAELRLTTDTVVPLEAAGPDKVTVPVDELPPRTVVGFRLIEATVAGVIFKLAVCCEALSEAVMITAVWELTPEVVTVNVPPVWPAGIVVAFGTVAAELPLRSETEVPPGPA